MAIEPAVKEEKPITDKELLTSFLKADEKQVLKWFAELGAERTVKEPNQFVYIPGTRSDRVLLVGHADTVLTGAGSPLWLGDICVSGRQDWMKEMLYADDAGWGRGAALGADDRAGCAMIWALAATGHSILITNGEERGLVGARCAAEKIPDELAKHAFAVEIDRRGNGQAVFYSVATEDFKAHILGLLTAHDPEKRAWRKETGSVSDISHICERVGICGVNLAAGYFREHSEGETLVLSAWRRTFGALSGVLAVEGHQRWVLPEKKSYTFPPTFQKPRSGKNTGSGSKPSEQTGILFRVGTKAGGQEDFVVPFDCTKTMAKRLKKKVQLLENKGRIEPALATSILRAIAAQREAVARKEEDKAIDDKLDGMADCQCGHGASLHWIGHAGMGGCRLPMQQCRCVRYEAVKESTVPTISGAQVKCYNIRCLHSKVWHTAGTGKCETKTCFCMMFIPPPVTMTTPTFACLVTPKMHHVGVPCDCKSAEEEKKWACAVNAGVTHGKPCTCVALTGRQQEELESVAHPQADKEAAPILWCVCEHVKAVHLAENLACNMAKCICKEFKESRRTLPQQERCTAIEGAKQCSKGKGHDGHHWFPPLGASARGGLVMVKHCLHFCKECKAEWWHKKREYQLFENKCSLINTQPCPKHMPTTGAVLVTMESELPVGEAMKWGLTPKELMN